MENGNNTILVGPSISGGENSQGLANTIKDAAPEYVKPHEVFGIELHAGVNFGGFVAGTINRKNAHGLTLTEEFQGIRVKGPKCNKLVPWAAMKGIDYLNDDGTEPLSTKSRV